MGEIVNNGIRTVLVETKLPPAIPWTNDIVNKIRDSLNTWKEPFEETYVGYGNGAKINWKLVLAGLGVGVVAIILLRKRG